MTLFGTSLNSPTLRDLVIAMFFGILIAAICLLIGLHFQTVMTFGMSAFAGSMLSSSGLRPNESPKNATLFVGITLVVLLAFNFLFILLCSHFS